MRQFTHIMAGGLLALLLAACGSAEMVEVTPPKPTPVINELVKDAQLQKASAAALLQRLKDNAMASIGNSVMCLTPPPCLQEGKSMAACGGSPIQYTSPPAIGSEDGTFAATATNNQEAGIDEHDTVKMQGDYAYVLQEKPADSLSSIVRIMRVHPKTEFAEVAQLPIEGTPIGLQISGTRLAVLTTVTQSAPAWKYFVHLTLVDIQNPAAPAIVRTVEFEAWLETTRRIGSKLLLVLNGWIKVPNAWAYWNPYAKDCAQKLDAELATRKAKINALTLPDFLPELHTLIDAVATPVMPDQFYTNQLNGNSLLIVATIDMEGDAAVDHVSALYGAAVHTVYVSRNTLYAAQLVYYIEQSNSTKLTMALPNATAIHAFDMTQTDPEYIATGGVKGTLLNQFAMSEYQGVLRVATGDNSFAYNANSIYTLDATVPGLPGLGKVTGLGNGEKLYAVRFVEDTGYVVTFKKVDPLFVIDLADPKNPAVAGELKVPGFSTYLHPIAGGKLIGLGKDADDQGAFAWFGGLKLSLFDVSTPSAPSEVASEIIGVRGSDSPALTEHHAFTYDATRQLLALPVSVCEGTDGTGNTFGTFSYSGLHLYEVVDSGFTLAGTVQDPKPTDVSQATCGWGTPTTIQRAVIMGDDADTQMLVIRAQNVELFDVDEGMTSLGVVGIKQVPVVIKPVID